MPKISVIMPVYNTEESFLREAIESILNQTYTDFELIIINDGSKDSKVEEVILSYKDSRIRYEKQENMGIAKTLNKGIDIAQGEYIARMDSDDISLPERFEKQVKYLDEHPEVSVLGTNIQCFPDAIKSFHPKNIDYFTILKGSFIAHPTVIFRKNDFDKYNLRYNPEFLCEDYELWSRAVRFLKLENLEDVLLKYRWHSSNLSYNPKMEKHVLQVQENMIDFLTKDRLMQEKLKDLVNPPLKLSFIENIFSIKNNKDKKFITIFGFKFVIKRK